MNTFEPFDRANHLSTGSEIDPFLPKLLQAINRATDIFLAVSRSIEEIEKLLDKKRE